MGNRGCGLIEWYNLYNYWYTKHTHTFLETVIVIIIQMCFGPIIIFQEN